jgi:hypothetical protein
MNIREELTKHRLLVKYSTSKTLNENVESMVDVEKEMGENILPGLIRSTGKKLLPALDDVVKFATQRGKSPIMVLDTAAQGGKRAVQSGDDLLKILKAGSIDAENLARVNIGMFKAANVSDDILKALASDIVKQKEFIKKYQSFANSQTRLKKELIKNGYSDAGSNALIAEIKSTKSFSPKPKPKPKNQPTPPPPPPVPPQYKKWFPELIEKLKKKETWKDILKWGLGIGIPAAIIYAMVVSSGEPLPSDIEEPKIDDSWAPCIKDLLKSKQGVLNTNKDGSVSVLVKSTEYPAGLMFYSNGRVYNIQTKQKGSWSCKNSQVTIQESKKISLIGLLNEQGDDIATDVNKMIDYLDFPVSYNNLVNAKTTLKKYADSGRGKEFLDLYQQSGLGKGSLGKSLKNIVVTEPKSVQARNQLSALYNQVVSGKVTNTETTNTAGLGNINITWDGNPTPPTPNPDPNPNPNPNPKYRDCSSIDINKQGIEFGCKHPIVLEIQKCIFKDNPKYQTGNFGPKTMEKVGGNLITKEFYDKTMANCGSSSNVTTSDVINAGGGNNFPGIRNKVDASRFDYLNNPSSENPTQSSTLNATNDASVASTSTNESPEEFYNRLYNDGLLTGDVAETVYSDGTRYPPTKRIKYKGPDLSAERLQQLDTILGGFSPSYRRIKQKVKGEDMKYVWLQVKTKRKK